MFVVDKSIKCQIQFSSLKDEALFSMDETTKCNHLKVVE